MTVLREQLDRSRITRYPKWPLSRSRRVTICIAASWRFPGDTAWGIVTASDQMLTSDDIEFERDFQKVYPLTNNPPDRPPHVVAMVADDFAVQVALGDATVEALRQKPQATVLGIANTYAECFSEYRRREAERNILAPLGLTLDSFVARQREMTPEMVRQLKAELHGADIPALTIICGVGDDGAHIYTVSNPGIVRCHDGIGFVAIGYGSRHAESLLMAEGYCPAEPPGRAFFLTYAAKRRAETAPSVGSGTDMAIITRNQRTTIYPAILKQYEAIYQKSEKIEKKARTNAAKAVEKLINGFVEESKLEKERIAARVTARATPDATPQVNNKPDTKPNA